jgi:hypothetical protein
MFLRYSSFSAGAVGQLRDELNFLNASSVCEWNDGESRGALCNEDDLVVTLDVFGKSKHEEGIVLISKFRIDSPAYFPFRIWGRVNSARTRRAYLVDLPESLYVDWCVLLTNDCPTGSHFLAILFEKLLINSRVPFRANSEGLPC